MIKRSIEEFEKTSWSGGTTTTILLLPKGASLADRTFDLRISVAEIEVEESTFSDFTGYKRYFSVLTDPVKLLINGKEQSVERGDIITFLGSDETKSFGKTTDFNVITKRDVEVNYSTGLIKGRAVVLEGNTVYFLEPEEELFVEKAFVVKIQESVDFIGAL
ncbi:HutD family protein [Guggenheimella bovis]